MSSILLNPTVQHCKEFWGLCHNLEAFVFFKNIKYVGLGQGKFLKITDI